jgi:hypothetical protein
MYPVCRINHGSQCPEQELGGPKMWQGTQKALTKLCLFVLGSSQSWIQWYFGFSHLCLPSTVVVKLGVAFLCYYLKTRNDLSK